MKKAPDPYLQWLGIRDPQRPLNHYRLLGLELFEDDADVIQNAADARMSHVRTYQTGPHSKISQQILNELSSAKLTLLNLKKKADYDAQLRKQQAAESPPSPMAVPPIAKGMTPTAIPVAKPLPNAGSTISKAIGPGSTVSKARAGSGSSASKPGAKPAPGGTSGLGNAGQAPLVAKLVEEDDSLSMTSPAMAEAPEDSVDLAVKELTKSTGRQPQGASRYIRQRKQNGWVVPAAVAAGVLVLAGIGWVVMNSGEAGSHVAVNDPKNGEKAEISAERRKGDTERPRHQEEVKAVRPVVQPPQPPVEPPVTPPVEPPVQPPVQPPLAGGVRPEALTVGEARRFNAGDAPVVAVGFSTKSGRLRAVTTDRFNAWNAETGQPERSDVLEGRVRAAVLLPQGAVMAAQDRTVFYLTWRGERRLLSPGDQGLVINRLYASGNGARVIGTGVERALADGAGARQVAVVWDVETGALIRRLNHPASVMAAALSFDGTRAFTGTGDRTLRLWDLTSANSDPEVLEQDGDQTYATAAVFSLNGEQLFTFGLNGIAKVWDAKTGAEIRNFSVEHQASTVEMSPDGKHLLTGGNDRLMHLYDLKGNELGRGVGHTAAVTSVQFSADGRFALTGSNDRTVSLWDLRQLAPRYSPGEAIPSPTTTDRPPMVVQQPEPPTRTQGAAGDVLGEPLSPVDLFARVYYSPDALRAEVEAVPKPKGTPAVPPRELPKSLANLVTEPLPAPAPLINDKALAVFNGTYEARIVAADKTKEDADDFALATELRELAVSQRDNPGLARYALLRAFGLSSNGKGDPDLAEKIAESFNQLTVTVDEDVRLACLAARMNLLAEVQKVLRKFTNKREAANSLNDHIISAQAAVAEWLIEAHHYGEAKTMVAAITARLASAKDAELKNLPKTLREKITEGEKRMNDCLRLVAAVEAEPDAPKACEELGLFYLGELRNLALAAPLMAKSGNDSLTSIARDFEAAPKNPKQYFTLAQQLDGYAQTLGAKPTTLNLKSSSLRLAHAAAQRYIETSGLTESERGQGNLLLTSLTNQVAEIKGHTPITRTVRIGGAKQQAVLVGHTAKVGMITFSTDGKLLSSGDWAGELRVWDVAAGKLLNRIAAGEALSGSAFTPDGRSVYGDVGPELRFFDTVTGEPTRAIKVGFAPWSTKWSPDGKLIVCVGEPANAMVFDAASGKAIGPLVGHGGRARSAAFHPSGRFLATSCDDKLIRLWDMSTGKEKAKLAGHTAGVEWVTYTLDGRLLASAGADGTARLWDPVTGNEKAVLQGHAGIVHVAAFTPDGRTLVTAGADGTVRFWDTADGKETGMVKAHPMTILAMAISPDGRTMATGGLDNEIKLWTLLAKR